ncbi:MAG: hypothetical protein KBD28_03555 [Chitinophagaceae bacterium]|nr:hypothetical protein [Chitinophagaceae bacterium]
MMVFITNYLGAQSVDPETFPTVVGAISGKNLYTNTGGEGKISIKTLMDSVDILDTATITYADFYTAITGGNLVVGKTYIIMDFQTVYDQMDFDAGGSLKPTLVTKTGSIEQIWVLALAPNQIASQAYSATYPNDKIQYDWTYNTTLVNGSPAKGRISERIDENNNRTDYDHRTVLFIRYDNGSGVYNVVNDNGAAWNEYLTFGTGYNNGAFVADNYIGDIYNYRLFLGADLPNNVFQAISACFSNKLDVLSLNNTFGDENYSNSLGDSNTYNVFGNNNYLITIGHSNNLNNFGNSNYSYKLGDSNSSNTFGSNNSLNMFGDSNTFNIFGDSNSTNTFGDSNTSNVFDTTQSMTNKIFGSYIQNKDFTAEAYMNNTDYEVKVALASDGNVYARYYNGSTDSINLIP